MDQRTIKASASLMPPEFSIKNHEKFKSNAVRRQRYWV